MNNQQHTELVKKINALRALLRKNPGNKNLEARILAEENKLYSEELNKSEEELQCSFGKFEDETEEQQ